MSLTDAVRFGNSSTPRLLPTPTASDVNDGDSNVLRRGRDEPENLRVAVRLLPTPQAADGEGGRQEKGVMGAGGVRPSGHKATLTLGTAAAMREEISDRPFASDGEDGQMALLPTPVANDANPGAGGELRAALVHGEGRRNETGVDSLGRPNHGRRGEPLLPTPTAQLQHDSQTHRSGERGDELLLGGIAKAAADASGRLLPTPQAADGERASLQGPRHYAGGGDNPTLLGAARRAEVNWGVYEGAVRRWEAIFGEAAPTPTDERGRLNPDFAAWMLGYPRGWFDIEGVTRTKKLRAIGNSVQVQAAEQVGLWLAFLVEAGLLG